MAKRTQAMRTDILLTPYSPPCLVVRGALCEWNSKTTGCQGFARVVCLLVRGIFPQ
jgi:hypothetical protein